MKHVRIAWLVFACVVVTVVVIAQQGPPFISAFMRSVLGSADATAAKAALEVTGGEGGSAPVGTVVNTGASTVGAVPRHTDLTGTNTEPTSVTIDSGIATGTNFRSVPTSLSLSGTNVTVDFSASGMRTLSLTTNALFAASNLSAGTRVTIRLLADSTTRNLYWPAGWIPIGAPKPGSIAASKYAECELVSWGTTDADVTIKYAEQP